MNIYCTNTHCKIKETCKKAIENAVDPTSGKYEKYAPSANGKCSEFELLIKKDNQ